MRNDRAGGRIAGPVARILTVQGRDGAIPWFEDGPWDAWNHAECVMALGVAGERDAAWAGFEALMIRQAQCGGFPGEYGNALPMTADLSRIERVPGVPVLDTNFTAYVASAAWHAHLLGETRTRHLWPMIDAAIDHVLLCQHPGGDVSWCREAHDTALDDALIPGNASIYASLGHALAFAAAMGKARPDWEAARMRLRQALLSAPHRFGRSDTVRSVHAMDWYYPVLAGVHPGREAASEVLHGAWDRFVEVDRGCRCVEDQPWFTIAETCELAIAAVRAGLRVEADHLLRVVEDRRDADGAFWMGWQDALAIHWPLEKPAWTQAAYVLALDAVHGLSPAAGIFTGRESEPPEQSEAFDGLNFGKQA